MTHNENHIYARKENLLRLVHDGIVCITKEQQADGGFLSLSSSSPDIFEGAAAHSTTFFASTILSCIASVEACAAIGPGFRQLCRGVQDRAANFLIAEKSERWSFNYWSRASRERAAMPYPDDLDDTFAALAALFTYDRRLIDVAAIAAATKLLISAESREGGPYHTWFMAPDAHTAWCDVDVAVNSTVAYFLLQLDVRLPNLERFVGDAIRGQHIASPYYPGPVHVLYFISRSYRGNETAAAIRFLFGHYKEFCARLTPLERAMIISSLINFGCAENILADQAACLASAIEQNGWRPYAFCIDPARAGKTYYAGSPALTAAFCVEAVSKYLAAERLKLTGSCARQALHTAGHVFIPNHLSVHGNICALAEQACGGIGAELESSARHVIAKTTDKKITALPYEFHAALGKNGSAVPTGIVEQLALANLYGWMSYAICDDLLDGNIPSAKNFGAANGDESAPRLLPCANFFIRKLAGVYTGLGEKIPGAQEFFERIMNAIDNANAWEQAYCRFVPNDPSSAAEAADVLRRFPDFITHEYLAQRSIGHALGPLTELLAVGYLPDSDGFQSVESFFRHYLIARQLHDDAHDWIDDLMHGRLSSVGVLALTDFQKRFGGKISVLSLPELRLSFWNKTLDAVVSAICTRVAVARRERERSGLLAKTLFMENVLFSLEESARRALNERDETLAFLRHY